MKAICENELVIDCAGYKAIDSGVILMGDEERKDVVAYVPNEKLEFVLPEDVAEREYERLGLPAPEISSPEDMVYVPSLFVVVGVWALFQSGFRNLVGPVVLIGVGGAWQAVALDLILSDKSP